jgi:hypothetical protein
VGRVLRARAREISRRREEAGERLPVSPHSIFVTARACWREASWPSSFSEVGERERWLWVSWVAAAAAAAVAAAVAELVVVVLVVLVVVTSEENLEF